MKKIILFSTLLIFICSFGQTVEDNSKSEIEIVPLYPGCKKRSNSTFYFILQTLNFD